MHQDWSISQSLRFSSPPSRGARRAWGTIRARTVTRIGAYIGVTSRTRIGIVPPIDPRRQVRQTHAGPFWRIYLRNWSRSRCGRRHSGILLRFLRRPLRLFRRLRSHRGTRLRWGFFFRRIFFRRFRGLFVRFGLGPPFSIRLERLVSRLVIGLSLRLHRWTFGLRAFFRATRKIELSRARVSPTHHGIETDNNNDERLHYDSGISFLALPSPSTPFPQFNFSAKRSSRLAK